MMLRSPAIHPPRLRRQVRLGRGMAAAVVLLAATADAQSVRIGGAVLSLGGEVSGSLAEKSYDYFNDTEYQRSLLRLLRLRLAAELGLGEAVALLAELRTDNLDAPSVYAIYLRVSPWRSRAVDLQVGQIPPVFGAFARRYYAYENPLIGFPLGYHYLTTVRRRCGPGQRRRPALPTRPRGRAAALPDRLPRALARSARIQRAALGHGRAAADRRRSRVDIARRHPGDARQPTGEQRQRGSAARGSPGVATAGRDRARSLDGAWDPTRILRCSRPCRRPSARIV